MAFPSWRCPQCRAEMTSSAGALTCPGCSAAYAVRGDVPLFVGAAADAKSVAGGLAESTFQNPDGYGLVVSLKRFVFKDAALGTEPYIEGKHVLDIGCGPNLDFDHLENHPDLAASYIGIDASAEFVLNARARHKDPKFAFAQAFASRLPLADKSVDTTLLSFVIHHIEEEFDRVMAEVLRVTRDTVIIFDHLKSTNPVLGGVQQLYWNLADGGCAYQTETEWTQYLQGVRVEKRVRTGAIFGHVVKYLCKVPQSSAATPA